MDDTVRALKQIFLFRDVSEPVLALVEALLTDLGDAAPDDVVDERGVEADPVGEPAQGDGTEVGRMGTGEGALAAAHGGPHGLDDDGVAHGVFSPGVGWVESWSRYRPRSLAMIDFMISLDPP